MSRKDRDRSSHPQHPPHAPHAPSKPAPAAPEAAPPAPRPASSGLQNMAAALLGLPPELRAQLAEALQPRALAAVTLEPEPTHAPEPHGPPVYEVAGPPAHCRACKGPHRPHWTGDATMVCEHCAARYEIRPRRALTK